MLCKIRTPSRRATAAASWTHCRQAGHSVVPHAFDVLYCLPGSLPLPPQPPAVTEMQRMFNYSDVDLLSFLVNTECLEATFDSVRFGGGCIWLAAADRAARRPCSRSRRDRLAAPAADHAAHCYMICSGPPLAWAWTLHSLALARPRLAAARPT